MIVAKIVGSIIAEQADRRYFGGSLGQATHTVKQAVFLYKLARALTIVKHREGRALADEVADAVRGAVPVRSGALRDSVRVIENKNGTFTVRVGGTPETMKPYGGRRGQTNREVREQIGAVTVTDQGGGSYSVVFDEALAVEYGTTRMAAQPFFWPAVRPFEKRIEKSLAGAIEKEFSD